MSWSPISLAVPQYSDANGDPYSGAVLKAYASGTSTPISMATDSTGGTTVGSVALNASGYPAVSGNVIVPHVSANYKLVLYPTQAAADANSGALWSVDALIPSTTNLAASTGSSLVGYISAGTGAVATTVQAKLRESVSLLDFGASPAAAAATNISAIQNAIASGAKEIRCGAGTYSLGTLSTTAVLFAMATKPGVRFVADGLVVFEFSYANNGTTPVLFQFTDCASNRFDGKFQFTDLVGYNTSATGVKVFRFGDNNTDFTFEDVGFSGALSGIEVAGTAHGRSVRGIKANIVATNVYYGLNCQNNGDDVVANIYATNCRREYFVYGVRNHRIKLTIVDKNIGNASKIASYEGANKTEDIQIDITAIWTGAPTKNVIDLSNIPETAAGITAGIENVRIHHETYAGSATASSTLAPIWLDTTINGGALVATNSNCVTTKLVITGSTNGYYVYDVYSQSTKTAGLAKGEAFWPVNAKLHSNALKVLHHAKTFSWTPVLVGAGWALGDGTAEGNYAIHNDGDSLTVWGKITFGSTSTYNNGATPSIELPSLPYPWAGETSFTTAPPSSLTMVGMANLWDSSAGNAGYSLMPVKASAGIYIVFHGIGGYLLGNAPFTWATGDTIQFVAHVIHANTGQLAP